MNLLLYVNVIMIKTNHSTETALPKDISDLKIHSDHRESQF